MASPDLTPKLLLFLSVDLSGSTAYKLSHHGEGTVQPWLLAFKTFYSRFPEAFAKACGSNEVPALWKCLGDELIFNIRLKKSGDALVYVTALRDAVREYNDLLRQKELPLKLQSTSWLAGFPVTNAEVRVADFARPKSARTDFIGPMMDIGFRVAKFCTPRKFIVSVDLALMLLHKTNPLHFHFDNEETLKGVLQNRPYPILWIDMLDERMEDGQKLRVPPSPNDLRTYCEHYIEKTNSAIMRPFIDGDHDFHAKPNDWELRYDKACRLLQADEEPISTLAGEDSRSPAKGRRSTNTTEKRRELLQLAKSISKPVDRSVRARKRSTANGKRGGHGNP